MSYITVQGIGMQQHWQSSPHQQGALTPGAALLMPADVPLSVKDAVLDAVLVLVPVETVGGMMSRCR